MVNEREKCGKSGVNSITFADMITKIAKLNLVAKVEFCLVERRAKLNVFTKDGYFLTSYATPTKLGRGIPETLLMLSRN